jgi:hypothetical protein
MFEGRLVEVHGEYYVKNGAFEGVFRNKIVGQGLIHLANALAYANTVPGTGFVANSFTNARILVGTGAGGTTFSTTTLATPVNTNPDSSSLSQDTPSNGVYRTKFSCTWNAGSITGATVSEIGAFAILVKTLGNATTTQLAMFSRLSTADSEFAGFTINTAVPLTIEYRVVFTFT